MSMTRDASHVYALLADGTTVEIRPATPDDVAAVTAMHEAMSRENNYLRFFNFNPQACGIEARRICRAAGPDQLALLALAGSEVVGCASCIVTREPAFRPDDSERTAGTAPSPVLSRAEVAFAVADHMHHRGVATLLLEHLVSWARGRQITTFTAQALPGNRAMLNVFADAGLPVNCHDEAGVYQMTFPLTDHAQPATCAGTALDSYLDAVAERECRADIASLRHVLAPESVAVIGASRSKGTPGRAILDNIRAGGYAGRLYGVNPRARQIGG